MLKANGDGEEFPKAEILKPFPVKVLKKKKTPVKTVKIAANAPVTYGSFKQIFCLSIEIISLII
jgi:hypothetical protein